MRKHTHIHPYTHTQTHAHTYTTLTETESKNDIFKYSFADKMPFAIMPMFDLIRLFDL